MRHHKKAFLITPVFLVFAAGIVAVVMLLWNWLIPTIFGITTITYWQAAGLLILSRILFGAFWKGHHHSDHHHNHDHFHKNRLNEKWMKMSEEQREEFINRRREFFHGRTFDKRNFFGNKTESAENNEGNEGDKK